MVEGTSSDERQDIALPTPPFPHTLPEAIDQIVQTLTEAFSLDKQTVMEQIHRSVLSFLLLGLPKEYILAQTQEGTWIPLKTWIDHKHERHLRPVLGSGWGEVSSAVIAIQRCQWNEESNGMRARAERTLRRWNSLYPEHNSWYKELFEAGTGVFWPRQKIREGRLCCFFLPYRSPLDGLHYGSLEVIGRDVDDVLSLLVERLVERHPELVLVHS